jgi:hypothetical protein
MNDDKDTHLEPGFNVPHPHVPQYPPGALMAPTAAAGEYDGLIERLRSGRALYWHCLSAADALAAMQARLETANRVNKNHRVDLSAAQARIAALTEALEDVLPLAESFLNYMPDRRGHNIARLDAARAALKGGET